MQSTPKAGLVSFALHAPRERCWTLGAHICTHLRRNTRAFGEGPCTSNSFVRSDGGASARPVHERRESCSEELQTSHIAEGAAAMRERPESARGRVCAKRSLSAEQAANRWVSRWQTSASGASDPASASRAIGQTSSPGCSRALAIGQATSFASRISDAARSSSSSHMSALEPRQLSGRVSSRASSETNDVNPMMCRRRCTRIATKQHMHIPQAAQMPAPRPLDTHAEARRSRSSVIETPMPRAVKMPPPRDLEEEDAACRTSEASPACRPPERKHIQAVVLQQRLRRRHSESGKQPSSEDKLELQAFTSLEQLRLSTDRSSEQEEMDEIDTATSRESIMAPRVGRRSQMYNRRSSSDSAISAVTEALAASGAIGTQRHHRSRSVEGTAQMDTLEVQETLGIDWAPRLRRGNIKQLPLPGLPPSSCRGTVAPVGCTASAAPTLIGSRSPSITTCRAVHTPIQPLASRGSAASRRDAQQRGSRACGEAGGPALLSCHKTSCDARVRI